MTALLASMPVLAQRHELGLTLGRFAVSNPTSQIRFAGGQALQANYAVRLLHTPTAALYLETHFLAGPLRQVASGQTTATRDVASLYLTPGVRVKFLPGNRWSPWAAGGGGYGLYEHSLLRLDGRPNQASRLAHRGAWMVGGGLDVRVWRLVSLRGEVRNFRAALPDFNVPGPRGAGNNLVAGGGFVLRFGESSE